MKGGVFKSEKKGSSISSAKNVLTDCSTSLKYSQSTCCSPRLTSRPNQPVPLIPKTDWSRSSRRQLALLKAGSDPQQSKITSFFKVLGEVEQLIDQTPCMKELFDQAQYQTTENPRENQFDRQHSLLHRLMANAEKNASVLPQQRRHEEVLKKFATSLFIYCGALSYEFLHRNLPNALPSLRTVQRIVSNEYQPLHEGDFRFDELLMHLNLYKSSKVVTIGEDATRVIARVEYDSESNRLVGFVLPGDEEGLPISSSFIATSFESIKKSFQTGDVAKYAFVYMAQPLSDGVPAFCLACLGTNNKFTSDLVLKRWRYIFTECKKRGILVVSFGADGDSRELKAMQHSTKLSFSFQASNYSASSLDLPPFSIPTEWCTWFAMQNPTRVVYVQDTVHIGVKLKARLLKPSIVLPLGRFVAGVHHLHLVQCTFGKDKHGLRNKDVSHKDKQNVDAVEHLTSQSVLTLLSQIPDAQGTSAYLKLMKCIVDSYLDKNLSPLLRLEKAWYAVFFVRYWRWWLLHNPDYTLGNNFITFNAYVCIELNAHALIILLLTLRENGGSEEFLPWKLGSQSCEKIFRAARSLSSTFSTMVNFGMLGLMRRLHRLHVQFCLEAECADTGIKYPRVECHKNKEGHCKQDELFMLSTVTNESISCAVAKGKKQAQEMMESLGMVEVLKKMNAGTTLQFLL